MPDFKNSANRFAGLAAGGAKKLAAFTAKKTRNVSQIARLNVKIAGERDTIKQAYSEIGKLYYETHREDPENYFVQLCLEIDNALEAISAMENEIIRLKTQNRDAADPPADES